MLPHDFPDPVAALERSDNVVSRPATLSLRLSAATAGAEGCDVEFPA